MKKKILALVCLFLIGGLSTLYFVSCDKDTNCYVRITVVDEVTHLPIQGVFVKIDIDNSYVNAQGYTDAAGNFDTVFSAPALFNVAAEYETGYDSSEGGRHRLFDHQPGDRGSARIPQRQIAPLHYEQPV